MMTTKRMSVAPRRGGAGVWVRTPVSRKAALLRVEFATAFGAARVGLTL